MVKNQKSFTLTELLVVVVWILIVFVSAWGWVWNIIKLVDMDIAHIIKLVDMDSGVTVLFVLRIIGIFLAPLGVVVGFI